MRTLGPRGHEVSSVGRRQEAEREVKQPELCDIRSPPQLHLPTACSSESGAHPDRAKDALHQEEALRAHVSSLQLLQSVAAAHGRR
ncbi:hypothetical protein NDU88_001275 [Pleurodeles waltl]|uniref:Uncharacterized protein n=1 Tax=Pleurodeles waltl TaxID=8319 RepID=A0AAV7S843_PLEWA|nr:hypothetical protein NDU88_001275 [Pleurodeles waltl]